MNLQNRMLLLTLIASTLPSFGYALNSDQTQPYHIQANTVTYNRSLHTTIYLGNVHARQGTTQVTGDKVMVYNTKDSNKIARIIATGHPAKYSTLPDNQHKVLHAEANTIEFNPIKDEVLLVKNAKVTQEQNLFTGPHIWYDMKNQVVVSTSPHGHGRTTVVIQPQNKQ